MYRVYRGILQAHKRVPLAQQACVISNYPGENISEQSSNTLHWRRSSTTSVISSKATSISSYESSTSELPQQITHRRVTFSLEPELTIYEQTDYEEQDHDVFEDCIISRSVNEMETALNKVDSASNKETQL